MKPTKKQIKQVLTRAKKLVEKGWTCGTGARDKYGHKVHIHSKNAVRFCAGGAIFKSAQNEALGVAAITSLKNTVKGDVVWWNDRSTEEQVIDGFNKAIKSLGE